MVRRANYSASSSSKTSSNSSSEGRSKASRFSMGFVVARKEQGIWKVRIPSRDEVEILPQLYVASSLEEEEEGDNGA
ncbi:hypothetical protein PsorP6_016059 [Peronosclerospora sorghi]|uniref:Uncharacterized protein n=1 Tax=Peronosclerospora sorghi TaxID=230839 RepID=A0ACC0WM61_9STRA|nr:hypothetical protein PsorP6_016059 [Peronosclerospora sorghi]